MTCTYSLHRACTETALFLCECEQTLTDNIQEAVSITTLAMLALFLSAADDPVPPETAIGLSVMCFFVAGVFALRVAYNSIGRLQRAMARAKGLPNSRSNSRKGREMGPDTELAPARSNPFMVGGASGGGGDGLKPLPKSALVSSPLQNLTALETVPSPASANTGTTAARTALLPNDKMLDSSVPLSTKSSGIGLLKRNDLPAASGNVTVNVTTGGTGMNEGVPGSVSVSTLHA